MCNDNGWTMLDPFAGSGEALPAALRERTRCTDILELPGLDEGGIDAVQSLTKGGRDEQILMFMFPPPRSPKPYEVLKVAVSSRKFKCVVVIQETLDPEHCGNEQYVEYMQSLDIEETDWTHPPLFMNGFASNVWLITL